MCRLAAQELSQLKPRLDANNVRFVAVGLEELGLEEFVKGEFFSGELYVDLKKECYKKLGFRRLNIFTAIGSVFGKKGRDAISESKQKKIDGNLAGDGFQNGGTLVVTKDGKALLSYKQENPAEHVNLNDVLKSLGIEEDASLSGVDGAPAMTCDDTACSIPAPK